MAPVLQSKAAALEFTLPDQNSMQAMIYYENFQPVMYQGRNLDSQYHRFAHRPHSRRNKRLHSGPRILPSQLAGQEKFPASDGQDGASTHDRGLQMKDVGWQIADWKAHQLHVALGDFGSYGDVIGRYHNFDAGRRVGTTSRLQSAINGVAYDCAQGKGHKANQQKPGAIHACSSKVKMAIAGDATPSTGLAARNRRLRLKD